MRLIYLLCLSLLSMLLSKHACAQIYRCTDENGRPVFSQRPCGEDAREIKVEVTGEGISAGNTEGFEKVVLSNDLREIEREISAVSAQIRRLETRRDAEIRLLRRKKAYSANNLAGATWEESISTEMQMVADNYNAQITERQGTLNRLRDRQEKLVAELDR